MFFLSDILHVLRANFKPSFYHRLKYRNISVRKGGMANLEVNPIFVRNDEADDRIKISFAFKPTVHCKAREFNFDRSSDESIFTTLSRISVNVTKAFKYKFKNKSRRDPDLDNDSLIDILLLDDCDTIIYEDITNQEAWVTGRRVNIQDMPYVVFLNTPTVTSLKLPSSLISGFIAIPEVCIENANLEQCVFNWYREVNVHFTDLPVKILNPELPPATKQARTSEWLHVSTGYIYRTTEDDEGHRIKVTCEIPLGAKEINNFVLLNRFLAAYSPVNVEAQRFVYPFCRLQEKYLRQPNSPGIRVMSYNILADQYACSLYSKDNLFFHCDPKFLNFHYRQQIILEEILGYFSDIVLLQEVDYDFFYNVLAGALKFDTFTTLKGDCLMKGGENKEGSCILYNTEMFSLVDRHDINLASAIVDDPLFRDIYDIVCSNSPGKQKFLTRGTTLQVSALKTQNNHVVLAATTHFYFHPKASHIRLIQVLVCCRHLENLKALYAKQDISSTVIFSGDFNSLPHSAVYDYLSTGVLASNHADWFTGGSDECYTCGNEFRHGIKLTNASGLPAYTNYVAGFRGILDYIFIEGDVFSCVEMPTHQEVTRFSALPSPLFPSDHLPLIADIDIDLSPNQRD